MSSFKFSKKVALRYLWTKRSEAAITIITYISIIGVAIGVMVMTMVMAVMTGFENELKNKILGADAHITVRSVNGKIENWREVESKIKEIPGIKSVAGFTYNQALIRTSSRSVGLLLKGVEKDSAATNQITSYLKDPKTLDLLYNPPQSEIVNLDGESEDVSLPGILVGKELAQNLSLFPGQTVSVLSAQVSSSPFGLMPKFKRFVVVGQYHSGLIEYENGLAYVSMEESQKFFRLGDTVSGIEVRVDEVEKAPGISRLITDTINKEGMGYYSQDWTEVNRPFFEAMKLEQTVYFIVLLLIILTASFSIVSCLIMLVLEKRKDIAVMKTLGASTRSVANIFIFQGATIGAIGVISGLTLGVGGCFALRTYGFPIDERIFQMSTLPIHMDPFNFAIVGISAFAICCLATIYPARRASRLQPTEILRFE